MTEQRKLCKDCLYYKKSWLGHLLGINLLDSCYNPILTGDVITGDKKSMSCKEARYYSFNCGRDGKYFEQLCGDGK
jgi:hypothetical protein